MSNYSQDHRIQNTQPMPSTVGQSPIPFFALIIGIDDYANWFKLRGAVADAKAMKEYLVNGLQVSEHHIVTLYNEEATRNAIIRAFENLQDNELINSGDPIVIFYAGHGSERPAPSTWCPTGNIQCLVPQDCGAPRTDTPLDQAPIPDRTIGTLIEEIAKKKGDNITVIFDCCHASSAARDPDDFVRRHVDLDFNIPETLDEGIWGGRAASDLHGFAHYGIKSHVLLAACGENENAYECKNSRRGQFTTALLNILKTQRHAINDLTYAELLGRIQFDNQHPQCIGVNRNRILFNSRMPPGNQVYHPAHKQKGGKYIISAGLAHGVSHGAEITLYDDRKQKLGVALVDETSLIQDFETTITISVPCPRVSLANLTRVGKLPLYVDMDNHFTAHGILPLLQRVGGTKAQQFQLVEAAEAKLEVAMEGDQVVFKILDERMKRFGLTKLCHTVATPNHVARVLGSAAHFYWFLGLSKELELDPADTPHGVDVNFYTLNIDYDDFGLPLYCEDERIFSRTYPNLSDSGVIDLVVGPKYGLKIKNNTSRDLYLNVFLFNNSDLSIRPCYTQSSTGDPEAPLKRGTEFRIGYGLEGVAPLTFSLAERQEVDVSYLKIVFATRPIDLSDVEQQSPFLNMNTDDGTDDDPRGESNLLNRFRAAVTATVAAVGLMSLVGGSGEPADRWFTLDITLVQRQRVTMLAAM